MPVPVRIVTLLVALAAVGAGAVFIVIHYIGGTGNTLPTVDYTKAESGGQVSVVLQEDPQNNSATKPDWVSYFVMMPHGNPFSQSSWVHTTQFQVPENTRVNVTIYGYDGCTPLRNNYWSRVQGPIGGTVRVQQFRKTAVPLGAARSTSMIDSWAGCTVGHTFAIPSLHLFVPVPSPNARNNGNADLCGSSPCVSGPYSLEKFSFRTPDQPGVWRWQCFVPCGGGFIDGNGGPMQTLGFMVGEMEITA